MESDYLQIRSPLPLAPRPRQVILGKSGLLLLLLLFRPAHIQSQVIHHLALQIVKEFPVLYQMILRYQQAEQYQLNQSLHPLVLQIDLVKTALYRKILHYLVVLGYL